MTTARLSQEVSSPLETHPDRRADRQVLSVAEAAELLGVSAWLVLQQVRRGELPHKRCGRRIVFSRERLLAWLSSD
jgi:excisionase family DNA binding protein